MRLDKVVLEGRGYQHQTMQAVRPDRRQGSGGLHTLTADRIVQSGICGEEEMSMSEETFGGLFLKNSRAWGDLISIRHKRYGIWNESTWAETYEQAKYVALGLISLGFENGDRICLMGEVAPEMYWTMFGAWCVGGVTVGLFVDAPISEVKYVVEHCGAKFVIARDQEQVDKLVAMKETGEIPEVAKVIWWDPRGVSHYNEPWLISMGEVLALGRRHNELHPDSFEQLIERCKPDDPVTMFYTSGTTGLPKGVVHSSRTILAFVQLIVNTSKIGQGDSTLTAFPPATMGEPLGCSANSLVSGVIINIGESWDTMMQDMKEMAPSLVVWGPRQWEAVMTQVQLGMNDADFLKRFFYRSFLPVGRKVSKLKMSGKKPNLWLRLLHLVGEQLVFRPIRDKLALSHSKICINAGSMVGVDTFQSLRALGVPLRNGLGATETGVVTLHVEGRINPNNVGAPLEGYKVKTSSRGELLFRTTAAPMGYWRNPEATATAIDSEGWFHSGDAGYVDEKGDIFLHGRLSELEELPGGATYSPQFIEAQLRHGSVIREAAVIGGKERPYVCTLLEIDFEGVSRWAEKRRLTYTTRVDLSQKDEVAELVQKRVRQVNSGLPAQARIAKYVIMHKEFDADEGELTRTKKIKRSVLEQKYRDLLEAVYQGRCDACVNAQVTYKDGRTGNISAVLKIREVKNL